MKAWESIEILAEDLGISERTAWRWLKGGRIQRRREGDQVVFFLSENSTDADNDNVTDTDKHVTVTRQDDSNVSKKRDRGDRHRLFITKEKEVERPSQRVQDRRDDVEVVTLEVERQKGLKELKNVIGPQVSPELQKKEDKVKIKTLDFEEFEADRKLTAAREEEERRVQAEKEALAQKEIEQERLEEKRMRAADREAWLQGYQNKALTSWLPRGISITTTLRFQIKDEIKKALVNRSEDEDQWEIERLVRETVNIIIQPFLDTEKSKKKAQLIEAWVPPQIETYIKAQGLTAYVDAESKGRVKEHIRDYFMKSLTGNESFILSHQVTNLLDAFFKPVKEKVREAREEKEKERQEMEKQVKEKREADERVFWGKVKEKREKEEIGSLLEIGMNRFNYYLLANRKELGVIDAKEQERARRHLERELREEVEGNETDEEVERMTDEILDRFFFE